MWNPGSELLPVKLLPSRVDKRLVGQNLTSSPLHTCLYLVCLIVWLVVSQAYLYEQASFCSNESSQLCSLLVGTKAGQANQPELLSLDPLNL